jgi:hypothetical protein
MTERDDPLLRQALNVAQLLPTDPREALHILYLARMLIDEFVQPYRNPPVVH